MTKSQIFSECQKGEPFAILRANNFEKAKAFWKKEKEKEKECDCGAEICQNHKKDCVTQICSHCNQSIRIRNPSGFCDHLYYPDACNICSSNQKKWRDWQFHLKIMVLEKNALQYLKSFL